jgi:hypothetical protein
MEPVAIEYRINSGERKRSSESDQAVVARDTRFEREWLTYRFRKKDLDGITRNCQ